MYNQRLFACFEDLGIEVGAPDAGSPGAEASINATGEEIEAAIAECETRIGPQPMPAPLTDDEIVRMYDWAVETGACIRENGGQTTDPPSLEVYIETYRASLTGGASPWSPYDLVRGTTLFTLCPDFSLVP